MQKHKLILIFLIILTFIPIQNLKSGSVIIKKQYIGCLIYSRNKTPGARMAVSMFRKSLANSLKGIFSSHIFDPYKIASFFKDNKINKKNFSRMQANYPNINFFITARIYYRQRILKTMSYFKIRISIYRTGRKVKRIERFFRRDLIKNYSRLIKQICIKTSRATGKTWVQLPHSIIKPRSAVYFSRGKYFLKAKKYSAAVKNLQLALKTLSKADEDLADAYTEALIKLNKEIPGLKEPKLNQAYINFCAAVYYFKIGEYEKALKYAKEYKKNTKKTDVLFKKIKNGYKSILSYKYLVLYKNKDILIIDLKNPRTRYIHEYHEKINTITFINGSLVINDKIYSPKNLKKISEELTLIKESKFQVVFINKNGKYILVHKTGSNEKIYPAGDITNTKVSYKYPFYVLTTGKNIYVFNKITSKLQWEKTLKYKIKNITPLVSQVSIEGKNEVSYFKLYSGRKVYNKKFKSAYKIHVGLSKLIVQYYDRIVFINHRTRRRWKKIFNALKVIDIDIFPKSISVVVTDNNSVSYRYVLNNRGKIIFRKIMYGKLLDANLKMRFYVFDGYFLKYRPSRNLELKEEINLLLSKLYSKLSDDYNSNVYLFKTFLENPVSFRALSIIKDKLKSDLTEEELNNLKNAFEKVFKNKKIGTTDKRILKDFIFSHFIFPFFKEGYKKYLINLGYKIPKKIHSLRVGYIKRFQVKKNFLIINYKKKITEVINLNTGKIIWRMKGFIFINRLRQKSKKLILYNEKSNFIICVNYKNGSFFWTKRIPENYKNVNLKKLNKKKFIYCNNKNHACIARLNIKTGKITKKLESKGRIIFGRNNFFILNNKILIKYNGNLNKVWQQAFNNAIKRVKLIKKRILVFTDKLIHFLNLKTGKKIFTAIISDKIFAITFDNNGNIYSIEKNKKQEIVFKIMLGVGKIKTIKLKNKFNNVKIFDKIIVLYSKKSIKIISKQSLQKISSIKIKINEKIITLKNVIYKTKLFSIIFNPKKILLQTTFNLDKITNNYFLYRGSIISSDIF